MKQITMFDGVENINPKTNSVDRKRLGKRVTCWYLNTHRERKYNHYSVGWSNALFPTPTSPQQNKWLSEVWATSHKFLLNNVITDHGKENE